VYHALENLETVLLWLNAARGEPGRISFDRFYYVGLALLVAAMVALLIKAYREWQDIHDVEDPDSPEDLLKTFEQANAEGVLGNEELARVRARLTGSGAPSEPLSEAASAQPPPLAEGEQVN
jgi:hypothetical protein